MSHVIDRIFAEVCLDERVSDGIFKLDEEEHMNALRDYFVKKGFSNEQAVHVTNRMVEGKYPERQAYNKDGVLVTFPTPQHKAKAISRGTHFEKNPNPQAAAAEKQKEAGADEGPKKNVGLNMPAPDKKETEDADDEEEDSEKSSGDDGDKKVTQGDKELDIAPPQAKAPEPPPQAPVVPQTPQTPERIAAQKAVVQQMMSTDNTNMDNIAAPLTEACVNQLKQLLKTGEGMGLAEACAFLKRYVKS